MIFWNSWYFQFFKRYFFSSGSLGFCWSRIFLFFMKSSLSFSSLFLSTLLSLFIFLILSLYLSLSLSLFIFLSFSFSPSLSLSLALFLSLSLSVSLSISLSLYFSLSFSLSLCKPFTGSRVHGCARVHGNGCFHCPVDNTVVLYEVSVITGRSVSLSLSLYFYLFLFLSLSLSISLSM